MFQLLIRSLAREDIQQIVDYYDNISTQIADAFLDDLYSDLSFISQYPMACQIKYRQTRVKYMRKFPFGVHYQINESKVNVLAVLHTSQNPGIWNSRQSD
jgi:plasmid stabilization system protein ParE